MDKVTKKGQPFVSLLVLDEPNSEDGTWMSLFDTWYFGGAESKPSPYDIRKFADRDDPQPVVYEAEQRGEFMNCLRIRPASEKWEPPEGFANVKGEPKPVLNLMEDPGKPYEGPLVSSPKEERAHRVAGAILVIKKGLDMLEEALNG